MDREEKLAELLKNFVEREICLHEKDDQPYSIDWVLIGEAEEALGETFERRWGAIPDPERKENDMSKEIDLKIQSGPCVVCGEINYPLSMGGPTICPACDCGQDIKTRLDFHRGRISLKAGRPDKVDDLIFSLGKAAKRIEELEKAETLNQPHLESTDCPTYHDGCHCTVETLIHNIQRAEKAAERIKELEAENKKLIEGQ